jgi:hypothetical protein
MIHDRMMIHDPKGELDRQSAVDERNATCSTLASVQQVAC